MTDNPTGPLYFESATSEIHEAFEGHYRDGNIANKAVTLLSALLDTQRAHIATQVMIAEILCNATGSDHDELDAWREVIPLPPLKWCKSKDKRRPACAERHTEDCDYTDPVPEPKHELLPIGTRVLVSDWGQNDDGQFWVGNPQVGRISGYDMSRSKYRWQREWEPGRYASYESWAFVDNRVVVHPDGPECPPTPAPVKHEPTAPRVYIQGKGGQQGYIVGMEEKNGRVRLRVHWLRPGGPETWYSLDDATIITDDQVQRCENGADQENCVEIDLCESCEQDRDAEGDEIEESMGLR